MFIVEQTCGNATLFNWAYRVCMQELASNDIDSYLTCMYGA